MRDTVNEWLVVLVVFVLMIPMGVDWVAQSLFVYDSPAGMRMLTGLLFGYLRGALLLSMGATLFERMMK